MLASRYQDYMFGLLKKVIDEIGPRPACSEAEKKLGRLLVEEWKPVCDRVDVESFTCSPRAYMGHLRLSVLFCLVAVILYWFYPPASFALVTLSLIIPILESRGCREVVDFLFARKRGDNIIAVIQPREEARQRVIVSAHQDSANEFYLLYRLRSAALVLMAIAFLGVLLILGGSLARTVAYFIGSADAKVYTVIGIVAIALTPMVGATFFFYTNRSVPGAMDDMAGLAVVSGLGRCLDEAEESGHPSLRSTEVVLLATSSEEVGMRGAKRYVERHLNELKEIPTYGLFLECICDEELLTVIDREPLAGARHDPHLVKLAQEAAGKRGWPIRTRQIGVGFSDSSAFSLKGIPAICLLCADSSRIQLMPNYHNRNDVYEHIHPKSLWVSLQMVIDIIERIDRDGNP
jgi:hypothetical protein